MQNAGTCWFDNIAHRHGWQSLWWGYRKRLSEDKFLSYPIPFYLNLTTPPPHSRFHPAAKLRLLEHYYNHFKLEKQEKSATTVKNTGPPVAGVTVCNRKQDLTVNAMAQTLRFVLPRLRRKPQHHWPKTCRVTHGVYPELSTHTLTLEWFHISEGIQMQWPNLSRRQFLTFNSLS